LRSNPLVVSETTVRTGLRVRLLRGVRNGHYAQLIFDPKHRNDREVAESLTQLAPLTLDATKESMCRIQAARAPHRAEGENLILSCYMSDDFRGAVRAFVEKRKYTWTGR
jgi:hypothetical protein